MINMSLVRAMKFAAMVVAGLSLAACSTNPNQMAGANAGLAGSAAPGSAQDFVVNVGDRVFFESDSSELTPQSIATLDKQAQWLGRYNRYAFTVEGHADERGTREYNIALGQKRADAVKNLMLLLGATEIQIETVSFGKEKPRREGHDEASWAENRRVDIVHAGE